MEDSKALIKELCSKFNNESLKETLKMVTKELKEEEMTHRTKTEAIEDSINQVKRKNKQIESDIERLQLVQTKNANAFNKKNSERIKMSRRIIELEQDNEGTEMKINEILTSIDRLEEDIKKLNQPTVEELYCEIIKGFGVDFIEDNGKIAARIMNKNKNDIFMIDCSNGQQEACEKIWECINF